MPQLKNAICTSGTAESNTFNRQINTCRTDDDNARSQNLLATLGTGFEEQFRSLRAKIDDQLIMGDQVVTTLDTVGATVANANNQLDELSKKKEKLKGKLSEMQRQGEAADKSYLEQVYQGGSPQKKNDATLQDVALFLFFFGWFLIGSAFILIRALGPNSNWRTTLVVMVIYLLLTALVLAILHRVA